VFPQDSERNDERPEDVASGGEPAPPPEQRPSDPRSDSVVSINRATLRGVDFRKARFDKFSLAGCLFVSCDFRAIRFDARYAPLFAALPQTTFRDCRFDGADMRRVRPAFARFEHCTFDDTAIDGWKTEASEFIGCRFAGALGTVTFYGKPVGPSGRAIPLERKHNDFAQNDFRDADLDHVVFTLGIDIGKWDVQEERVAGLEMLRELSGRYREQNQIFASRVSASGHAARVQTRVWAALERATI